MTSFFEYQDEARQQTQKLLWIFAATVMTLIGLIYAVTLAILKATGVNLFIQSDCGFPPGVSGTLYLSNEQIAACRISDWWQPHLFMGIATVTLGVIICASLFKIDQLQQGGSVVAIALGGQRLDISVANPQEQMLLHVVEEMAIASGTPVPPVYLLPDRGINAFAAGFTTNDAVLGITQGCIQKLSRDQLQGVVAHEFSHILNGDMRLNLRLLGVTHGLLALFFTGRVLARACYGGSSDRKGNATLALLLISFLLMVTGLIGVVAGRLIKSAIAREREYLADASAVQFTRNPLGLAGALQRIELDEYGSEINHPEAESYCHLFFSDGTQEGLFQTVLNFTGQTFASHPPLQNRIARLGKSAGLTKAQLIAQLKQQRDEAQATTAPSQPGAPRQTRFPLGLDPQDLGQVQVLGGTFARADNSMIMGLTGASQPHPPQSPVQQVMAQVGQLNPAQLAQAQALLAQLPAELREVVHSPEGAIAVVYGLLLDRQNKAGRDRQLALLKQLESPALLQQTAKMALAAAELPTQSRLPLLELAIPSLRSHSPEQCQQLLKRFDQLAQADGQWSLEECILRLVLRHRLRPQLDPNSIPTSGKIAQLKLVQPEIHQVLTVLAKAGHPKDPAAASQALNVGLLELFDAAQAMALPPVQCKLTHLGQSLDRLSQAVPRLKQKVLSACSRTALCDGQVTQAEMELLRAIALLLDCPIPPQIVAQVSPSPAQPAQQPPSPSISPAKV